MAHAAKRPTELRTAILEPNRAENEADDALNSALAALYGGVTEVPTLIHGLRWGERYGLLEGATDRAEGVANNIAGILIKYA